MLFITTGRLFRVTITMLRFTVVEVWVVLNSRLNRCFGKAHFMLDIIYGLAGAKQSIFHQETTHGAFVYHGRARCRIDMALWLIC